jgi:hypothetical protein
VCHVPVAPQEALPQGLQETALLASLFIAYELLRMLGSSAVADAVERGWCIARWQSHIGLPSEAWAQGLVLPHEGLVAGVNATTSWFSSPARPCS